jgi:hypothetical protein
MPTTRGRMKYFPPVLIDELNDLKMEEKITIDHEAINKLVKYARIGREANRIMNLKFPIRPISFPVDSYPKKGRPRRMF